MNAVIIYLQADGMAAVVFPSPEALSAYGIDDIARKDVPAGLPYRIMDVADLPEGPQEEWVIDPATLIDGVGGVENTFPSDGGGEVESEAPA